MAKVHFTFANIPPRLSLIGESPLYFRQHALMIFTNWRMSTLLSPVYVIYRLEDSLSTTRITESNKIHSDIFSPHMYPAFIFLCNKLQKSIILLPTHSHDLPQLARAHRTFTNTSPDFRHWRMSYWRNSGTPCEIVNANTRTMRELICLG
jgi:hypothetical protein